MFIISRLRASLLRTPRAALSRLSFIGKINSSIKHVWRQTFPDDNVNASIKFEQRKQQAKKLLQEEAIRNQFTQEQLKQFQNCIPEYKRGMLMLKQQPIKKKSRVEEIKDSLKNRVKQTEAARKIIESEAVKNFTNQYNEFKEDLKNYVQSSNSNAVQGSIFLMKKVIQSNIGKATIAMQEYDPSFNIYELQKQAGPIFRTIYNQYLKLNGEGLQLVASDQALGYFKANIKVMKHNKQTFLFKQLHNLEEARLEDAIVVDKSLPVFTFKVRAQEIYCLVNEQGKIVDGDESRIMGSEFLFGVRMTGRGMSSFGFGWQIVQIHKSMQVKMLI